MNEFEFKLEPGKKINKQPEYIEKQPIISVIVPFYNSKKYIEQTIISVLNQTFPYYEILIISNDPKSIDIENDTNKLISSYHDEKISFYVTSICHTDSKWLTSFPDIYMKDFALAKSKSVW